MADDFNFWQDHSERFLVMANLYDRRKEMADADSRATKTGDCGDTVTLYLKINEQDIIKEVSFVLDGCMHTNACCNSLAEMIEGQPVARCWDVRPEDIIQDLETLPQDHYHCAELAVGTMYLAVSQYQKNR